LPKGKHGTLFSYGWLTGSSNPNPRKSARLGSLAGWVLGWFDSKKLTPKIKDVKSLDFSANTQKMGLRFPDSLREFFRFHWLRGR
jgi:hypothetical protein